MNELISITYYFGKVWWSLKEMICNSFLLLGGCGGYEITDF